MKRSSSSISERLRAADAYNKAHYERDPLHKEAADTIDELVRALRRARFAAEEYCKYVCADCANCEVEAIDAALRLATGEE